MPHDPDVAAPRRRHESRDDPGPSDRAIGWLAILAGAVIAFGLQVLAPVGVPLYDGVAVQEPYRYLHPTGDQPGTPSSFSSSPAVAGGTSPQVVAATTEVPPQAQLVVLPDGLVLTPGATALRVSIAPVDPPAGPAAGQIAGNVYRFSVTDQSGTPLAIKPCEGCISLVMRAPEDIVGEARLQRHAEGIWSDVETVHAGIVGMYSTNPTVLGDYAIVTGTGPGSVPGADPIDARLLVLAVAVGGVVVILGVAAVAGLIARRRRAAAAPAPVAPSPEHRSRAVPSKRKRPNRPPPGSPDS